MGLRARLALDVGDLRNRVIPYEICDSMTKPNRRAERCSAAIVVVLFLAAACSPGQPEPMTVPLDGDDRFSLEFFETNTACLRDNGYDLWPDPELTSDGLPTWPQAGLDLAEEAISDEQRIYAMDVCRPMMIEAEQLFLDEHGDQYHQNLVDFANCLRDGGVPLEGDPSRVTSFEEDPFDGQLQSVPPELRGVVQVCSSDVYKPWTLQNLE